MTALTVFTGIMAGLCLLIALFSDEGEDRSGCAGLVFWGLAFACCVLFG